MLMVSGIRIPLNEENEAAIAEERELAGVSKENLRSAAIRKLSYDARHGSVSKVCSVVLDLKSADLEKRISDRVKSIVLVEQKPFRPKPGKEPLSGRPLVVGFGPAGIFSALALAEHGYRPIVLERGRDVDTRKADIERFFAMGTVDPKSNVQFGEGGAGTFSDGKLTTRINDPLCDYILNRLVEYGAPESILYEAKPHIGSDLLGSVVKRIRERIEELGGEVRFESLVEDISVSGGAFQALTVNGTKIFSGTAIFATGHSARETVALLHSRGAKVVAKSFAVGLRIEHLQEDIDRSLWGKHAGNPLLPKGEYALSTEVDGRPVYTFCMCPGGSVVAAASERGGVVVNGMSNRARNGKNANSAIVVGIDESDFSGDPFLAISFQQKLEEAAYLAGGKEYSAPASDVGSFLLGRKGLEVGRIAPSYPLGVREADLGALLGERIADPIRMGILAFSEKIRGFDSKDAILTGVESRTSSPVRIIRNENREAEGIQNLYPCGEGSGYSGGIMSSAVDGLKTAAMVIERYQPFKN